MAKLADERNEVDGANQFLRQQHVEDSNESPMDFQMEHQPALNHSRLAE
ncbi:hypothetical protein PN498_18390 [Oscillatoria sp. CS-180]|nr:hypothetical protein [Oscillatoria sp. CS-180]MDB9527969.1 hypothetical protein [Oscillatoria sp. CS-180]